MTEEIINLREAQDQDVPFITNSWLKSYRHGGAMTKHVPNDIYYAQHHSVLERILPRGVVVVALPLEAAFFFFFKQKTAYEMLM